MEKMVEWEVTMKCNYHCQYCTNLDSSLQPVLDEKRLEQFVQFLGTEYPGVEIFVFGGEPFVHPKIKSIIKYFNQYEVPYVVQTNFSRKSVRVMQSLEEPVPINISIHPTEIEWNKLKTLLETPLPNVTVKTVDVMYVGTESMMYYLSIASSGFPYENLYVAPVADFGDGVSGEHLAQYNKLRTNRHLQKMFKFEDVSRFGRPRSEIWADKDFLTKGRPCLYNGKYFLYGPNLELYNCCYRVKHEGICNHDKCFLM